MTIPTTQSNDPAEREFTDLDGTQWALRLDYDNTEVIRDELNVDLGDVQNFAKVWGGLLFDDRLFLRVLWRVVYRQAGETSEKDWLSKIDGTVLESAHEALLAAIFFFTPPSKQSLVKKATDSVMRIYRHAIGEAELEIEKVTNQATSRALKALGTLGTKSRGSSATSTGGGRAGTRSRRSGRGGKKSSTR